MVAAPEDDDEGEVEVDALHQHPTEHGCQAVVKQYRHRLAQTLTPHKLISENLRSYTFISLDDVAFMSRRLVNPPEFASSGSQRRRRTEREQWRWPASDGCGSARWTV